MPTSCYSSGGIRLCFSMLAFDEYVEYIDLHVCPPPRSTLPWGDPGPHLIRSSLGPHELASQTASRSAPQFSHCSPMFPTHTDQHTNRGTSVANLCIATSMWCICCGLTTRTIPHRIPRAVVIRCGTTKILWMDSFLVTLHCVSKKRPPFTFAITSSDVGGFS